ncbi:hypothetical protein ACLE2W_23710 [Pseudomonas shahriarae]|uniref:hypothetical protein n=1 Tax=Pseudomonas shahriarae TaxID=2745512 RepID=UPI002076BB22|nr:hypothetical protein [Pseudomonas shahriarae]MCM8563102.1 hypothetical protein [Pseudomonas shahriarae]
MDFGLSVFDANGIKTLGMEDFTLQKLAVMIVPAAKGGGQGSNYEYILMDVPGYDPATCFVTITPKVYAPYDQLGYPDTWGGLPTYSNLGGTRIAIITQINYREPDGGGGGKNREMWTRNIVESVVEVVKVS